MKATVRIARREDAEHLAIILIEAWHAGFRGILPDAVIAQYTQYPVVCDMFRQILDSGRGTMYISHAGRTPAGLLYRAEDTIEALLTVPEVWGKGVSGLMMARMLQDMSGEGFSHVHVFPFTENHRARRFYEKHGFHPTGNTRMGDAPETEYVRPLGQLSI